MQELEIVRETIQNEYRVVKTDEDLEWNRAIDLCTNIINARLSSENASKIARSSRDNNGWIPVEERLPEAGQRVIATIKHHAWISDYDQNWVPESEKTMHQEYTESCEAVMAGNGIWSYRCKEDDYDMDTASVHPGKSLAYPIAEVIAWRPLPEPYRSANKTEASDWREDMLRKFNRRD